ncbi:MAG: TerB family tellurite resistance protein [Bdellovibrionales bacterium]|nr:TerB family tellurite resistance protein [Bdellovibrionales bacterium]
MKPKDFFFSETTLDHDKSGEELSARLKVAVAVILCEMAHVDDNLDHTEFDFIIRALDHQFHLMDEEAEALREIATELIKDKSKVDEFLDLINEHFSLEQRQKVYELAVEVAKADGIFDKFERFFSSYIHGRLGLSQVSSPEE